MCGREERLGADGRRGHLAQLDVGGRPRGGIHARRAAHARTHTARVAARQERGSPDGTRVSYPPHSAPPSPSSTIYTLSKVLLSSCVAPTRHGPVHKSTPVRPYVLAEDKATRAAERDGFSLYTAGGGPAGHALPLLQPRAGVLHTISGARPLRLSRRAATTPTTTMPRTRRTTAVVCMRPPLLCRGSDSATSDELLCVPQQCGTMRSR